MIKSIFRTKDRRLIAIYVLTTLLVYGAFWFAWYNATYEAAIGGAIACGIIGPMLLLIRKATRIDQGNDEYDERGEPKYIDEHDRIRRPALPFLPFVAIAILNLGIGFIISAFFLVTNVTPSRFFGLVLLIMLGYKIIQLLLGEFLLDTLKSKTLFGIFMGLCLAVELISFLAVLAMMWENPAIMSQVLFSLVLCVFYSLGQFYIRKDKKKNFWDQAAVAYLIGFIYVFVITVVLIALAASDGNADISLDLGGGLGGGKTKKEGIKLNGDALGDVIAGVASSADTTAHRESEKERRQRMVRARKGTDIPLP